MMKKIKVKIFTNGQHQFYVVRRVMKRLGLFSDNIYPPETDVVISRAELTPVQLMRCMLLCKSHGLKSVSCTQKLDVALKD